MALHPRPRQQVGYMASWSSYTAYRRQHPDRPDPLAAFRRQVQELLGIRDSGEAASVRVEWPLFLILAKDPVPLAPE